LHDPVEKGGFKAGGVGRMRGFAVIGDFVEFKHIRITPAPKRRTVRDDSAAG
jgi:hypothetical protein